MSEPHSTTSSTNNVNANDQATTYDGAGDPPDQRRASSGRDWSSIARTILVLIMLLLILLLIAAATGRSSIIRFANAMSNDNGALPSQVNGGLRTAGGVLAPGSMPLDQFEVGPTFRDYYYQHGGVRMFGLPISREIVENGRTIQWFERSRLERWPEYDGTPYAIQGGRVGVEFVRDRTFPSQTFFVSQPGLRFFPETSHSARDRFLQFWEQNDGLQMFGLPLSEQVQERLPDGQTYTVQYFERARLEYHPQNAGTPNEMMVGLIGTGLRSNGENQYSNDGQLGINSVLNTPTPVPLP